MIYHQIRFSVKPDVTPETLNNALNMLKRLGEELDVVETYMVGRDFGGEFEYGALYLLKDIAAYKAYMYAPLHRQIDEIGLPLIQNMISQDLTDDPDPAIGEKIAEVYASRFAGDAGLVKLIEGLGSYEGSGTK